AIISQGAFDTIKDIVVVRPIARAEAVIALGHHGPIAALTVRIELALNPTTAYTPDRIARDRMNRHNLGRLHPIKCAATIDSAGSRRRRRLRASRRNALRFRLRSSKASSGEVKIRNILALIRRRAGPSTTRSGASSNI